MFTLKNRVGIFELAADETIVGANETFLSLTGRRRAQLETGHLRLSDLATVVPERPDLSSPQALLQSALREPLECEVRRQDGQYIAVLFGAMRADVHDVAAICFIVDLSGARRAQVALRQAMDEAESATRAKSDFLANISHELRTPLNAILGMTELSLQEPLPEEVCENLRVVRESANGLLGLLNDLLDFSKIESGKFDLKYEPFLLQSVIREAVESLSLRAREKGLEIMTDIAADVPRWLIGDATRLKQVITNLGSNAIKFTQHGQVDLSVSVSQRAGNQTELRFCVHDTGIGIATADQERIFAPFTQVDASSTRRYHGVGLGLTIAAELVELMGGHIWLESELGAGSRFFFTAQFKIPELRPESAAHADNEAIQGTGAPVVSGTQSNLAGSTGPRLTAPDAKITAEVKTAAPAYVLVVEDTVANQKVLQQMLRKRGHHVTVASNGQEALRLCRQQKFDIVLMDVQMPIMDGFQATAAIRALDKVSENSTPADVCVVALTAHAMKGDRQRCLQAGMDGYLAKPFDARQITTLVERLVADVRRDGRPSAHASSEPAGGQAAEAHPPATRAHDGKLPGSQPDLGAALQRLGGDQELLHDMIHFFLEDSPGLLQTIEEHLKVGKGDAMERAAHSLKGLSSNFDARLAAEAAAVIEKAARDGDFDRARATLPPLRTEIERLREWLRRVEPKPRG